jgi:3-oxoadipate enol-lactonase
MNTIVFVHAFGSSARGWTPQLRDLSDRYRVLAPDLLGHGQAPGPFGLGRAVQSLRTTIDEAGGHAHLVGISGGAVVCLLTCLKHAP